MPPRRRLNAVDRGRALAWITDGVSLREVGRRLQVSPSVIHRLHERFATTGSTEERAGTARPHCTSRQDDRFLCLSTLRDRTVTTPMLRRRLIQAANVNVSVSTVRNRLREFNLQSRRPALCVPLTPAHQRARLAWCRHHQQWNRQQWSRILFSEESHFTVSFNDGRRRVWRRPGERFIDATIREVDRYGGGSVMVWGGFHLSGRTPLHIIQGSLTGQRYRDEIVSPRALPTWHR